jgi:DNA-binding transcriptional ArsR family regulator
MLDVAVIDDSAAAEVSLDPVRARLLAALSEPGSASTLAAQVGLSRQKANYHPRALERHGLVEARERFEDAEVYWLSTVRPDGRPHVTPLLSVWLDGALYFCTGPSERKAKNLAGNPHCTLTTGCNNLDEGLDLVVEGDAARMSDAAALRRIADAYESKYGGDWRFDVRDGAFHHRGGRALVYEVAPSTAFGFGKGEFSQTRWPFGGVRHRGDAASKPGAHEDRRGHVQNRSSAPTSPTCCSPTGPAGSIARAPGPRRLKLGPGARARPTSPACPQRWCRARACR